MREHPWILALAGSLFVLTGEIPFIPTWRTFHSSLVWLGGALIGVAVILIARKQFYSVTSQWLRVFIMAGAAGTLLAVYFWAMLTHTENNQNWGLGGESLVAQASSRSGHSLYIYQFLGIPDSLAEGTVRIAMRRGWLPIEKTLQRLDGDFKSVQHTNNNIDIGVGTQVAHFNDAQRSIHVTKLANETQDTCLYREFPPRRRADNHLMAEAGPLKIRTAQSVEDNDADTSLWDGALEIYWNKQRCTYDNKVGTTGTQIYSSHSGTLMVYGLVSASEGVAIHFIDARTCAVKNKAHTPFVDQRSLAGQCSMEMTVSPEGVLFQGNWQTHTRTQVAREAEQRCHEQRWILNLDNACVGHWQNGAKPPTESEETR